MASLEEIREARIKKLEKLKQMGKDPFSSVTSITHTVVDLISSFDNLASEGKIITLGGRVMSIRAQGGLIFFNLNDGTGNFQVLLKKGEKISDTDFDLFAETIDVGDFVEATGLLFVTKRGEKTIQGENWNILTKTLRPLPDKWHGLQDVEARYRHRYLDILMNPELKDIFIKKTKFWNSVRGFMIKNGFMEVETPTLETTTGGAEATPFKTHHNDFDLDVYLRISVGELWQKRLMAAGFPKTFEIGRVYRNEGSSPEHLQEFTNLEFYYGYADYKMGMKLVKEMYQTIAMDVFGTTAFTTRGHSFDLSHEWKEIDYSEEIIRQTGVDISTASEKEIKSKLEELKVSYEGTNMERLIDTLWKYCRKNISGPAFLVNHPLIVSPLAKRVNGKAVAQMFQPILAGSEVGRGYSELNDPIDQLERFKVQQALIDKGDSEAMMADYEFVEMLEYGMPPTCGFGFGERFFAFLVDKPVREVQFFPLLRPEKK